MRNHTLPLALVTGTLCFSNANFQHMAVAQELVGSQPAVNQKSAHQISLRNVNPSLVAWWLDPTHNQLPFQARAARESAEILPLKPGEADFSKPLGDYKLPSGVDQIVAVDPQKCLMVFGTDAGVEALKKDIETLDKPLRMVEIEVQYLEVPASEVKKLNITDVAPLPSTSYTAGLVPAGGRSRTASKIQTGFVRNLNFTDLVQKNKARIISAPRLTLINKLTGDLRSSTSRPIVLGPNVGFPNFNVPNAQPMLYWSSYFGVTARPTINPDDTIDLTMAPGLTISVQLMKSETQEKSALSVENADWKRQLGGVFNLSKIDDGRTVAIMGLDSTAFITPDPSRKSQKPSNIILLVTPRIVRHAGEADRMADNSSTVGKNPYQQAS